jgi:HEAT repeat protein
MLQILIEKILTLKDQLAPASFLSSELLYIPTIAILILLVLTFALVLYVISLRIVFNTGQRSKKGRFEIWENLIFEYLSGEVSSQKIAKEVRIKDFGLFSEFMEKYLETLKGEDFQSLTHLLEEMGLSDYNLKRLGSKKRWHRVYAAFFLGLMRDKEAVPSLSKGVGDKDSLVSFVSATALAKIGEKRHLKETLLILTRRKDLRPGRAAGVLLEFGSGACVELGLLLGHESVTRQWKYLIIDLLGYWQHLEAGPMLLELLQASDDRQIKMRCIKALGQMSYLDSASTLASYLDDEDYLARLEAVKALGRIGIWDYSAKMARCLSDENWHVRYHTAQALAAIGKEGVAVLEETARQQTSSDAQRIASHVLSEIKLLGEQVT